MKLTAKNIGKLQQLPGRHHAGDGLYLEVNKTATSRCWVLRYERAGRERWMGLGPLRDFSLAEAREAARKARHCLHLGLDPIEARQAERAEQALAAAKLLPFEEAATRYLNDHQRRWRHSITTKQFIASMRKYVYPKLGAIAVAAIDSGMVLDLLKQPVPAKGRYPAGPLHVARPETASRVRKRIEDVLDWAAAHQYRSGENPARREVVKAGLPDRSAKSKNFPSMPYAQVPAFMVELRKRGGIASRALEFLILTAARTAEVTEAQWAEIDFGQQLWIIPAARMKAGEEHRIPLTDRAVEILKALPREPSNTFVFVGPKEGTGLSNAAMAALLKKRMKHQAVTVHGFSRLLKNSRRRGRRMIPCDLRHGGDLACADWTIGWKACSRMSGLRSGFRRITRCA